MKFLTVDARIMCKHQTGVVQLKTPIPLVQQLVTIQGRPVLVDNDPETKPILGCANMGLTIKPCSSTLKVTRGYSDLVFIDHQQVCLDTVTGLTDGTPPGTIEYVVRHPGQDLVEAEK